MSTTFSKKSKNLFFSSDVTVFSLHDQHDASLNFGFRTHIILAKIERDSLSDDAEIAQHSKRDVQNTRYLRGYKKQKTMSFLYNGLLYISSKLHTEFLLLLSFILQEITSSYLSNS